MIVLSAQRFRELVPMDAAVGAVRDAFIALSEGRVDQPPRLVARDHRFLSMMARVQPSGDTVVKSVTIYRDNPKAGLPTIQAVVVFFDGASGRPAAIIDGAAVTALRTGAASGVATDLLARPDAQVLAVIGSGGQAPDQIDAVCAVRDIREIRITSRNAETCRALAARMGEARPDVRVSAVASIAEAIGDADVICCATTSRSPLFSRSDIKPEVHINGIGAYTPEMCEIGPDVLAETTTLAVDQIESAMEEAGDVLRAIDAGAISTDRLRELGSLLVDPAAGNPGGVTVFKSVGVAAQDWAVSRLARERAAGVEGLQSVTLDDRG